MTDKKIIPYINGENESLHNILRLAKTYSDGGADELMIYNYSKEEGIREEFLSQIKKIMKEIDIPLHIGYHVSRMEDIKKALYTGASTLWIPYQDGLLGLLKDGVERFGGNRFVISFDMSDFVNPSKELELNSWMEVGVKALLLNHVVLQPASIELINQSKLPIYIKDSLIRNDISSLISIDSVVAIVTNFYENKDLMKAKLALKADGISVNVFETSIPFTEFKLNSDGLIPVIVQDYKTAEVLMLAYMNEEAYNKTIATGRMTYFSRSRQSLWIKGETSGHYQYLKKLIIDCDQDTILAKVRQVGPACHTGENTCFHKNLVEKEYKNVDTSRILEDVYQVIMDRKKNPKEGSYTNYLFDKGIDKILKKCGEESAEIIIAAKNPNAEELRYEISDYLYHLMVLMAECGLEWSDITDELVDRK